MISVAIVYLFCAASFADFITIESNELLIPSTSIQVIVVVVVRLSLRLTIAATASTAITLLHYFDTILPNKASNYNPSAPAYLPACRRFSYKLLHEK